MRIPLPPEPCEHGWLSHALHHEAAHAVSAIDLGFDFEKIVINPRPDPPATSWECDVFFSPRWGVGRDDDAMVVVLAGPTAEDLYFDHSTEGAYQNDLHAWRQGTGHTEALDPASWGEQFRQSRARARGLVARRDEDIRKVVAALAGQLPVVGDGYYAGFDEPLTLTYDDVQRLLSA